MIVLSMKDKEGIEQLADSIREGLAFLEEQDVEELSVGNYELRGTSLYIEIQEKETVDRKQTWLESHKRYIDVHVVIKGKEQIGYKLIDKPLTIHKDYDADKDLILYENPEDESSLILNPGELAIFYPEDAHRPGCTVHGKDYLKKAVIKIRV